MGKVRKVTEIPTIDVCLVVVRTKDAFYGLDTANKVGVEVQTEDTDAVKLVVKEKLRAQKPEKKTVTGNKLTLTDNVFSPELALFLQGGAIIYANNYTITITKETKAGNYYFKLDDMFLSFELEEDLAGNDKIIYNTATSVVKVVSSNKTYEVEAKLDYDFAEGAVEFTDIEKTADEENIAGYRPPIAGSNEKGEVFTTDIYSAQYDASGNIVKYEKISYPNCTGVPIALNSEDGAFRAPEYTINSAPKTGQAPYEIQYVPNLPIVI